MDDRLAWLDAHTSADGQYFLLPVPVGENVVDLMGPLSAEMQRLLGEYRARKGGGPSALAELDKKETDR